MTWKPAPDVDAAVLSVPFDASDGRSGDWWDAVAVSARQLVLTVGDVAGFGAAAAPEAGGLAQLGASLGRAGAHGDDLIRHLDARARALNVLATVVHVACDLDRHELRVWRAGHPPPLLITTDGTDYLHGIVAPPLSTVRKPLSTHWTLPTRSTLVLYSDGLIERRHTNLDVGMDRLRHAAHAARHLSPAELCRRLLGGVASPLEDDATVLVIRRTDGVGA